MPLRALPTAFFERSRASAGRAIGVGITHRRVLKVKHAREKAIRDLLILQTDDTPDDEQEEEMAEKLRTAFTVFDMDNSGQLDRKEMRLILHIMYPRMTFLCSGANPGLASRALLSMLSKALVIEPLGQL